MMVYLARMSVWSIWSVRSEECRSARDQMNRKEDRSLDIRSPRIVGEAGFTRNMLSGDFEMNGHEACGLRERREHSR
jgi:hypothetical protein